MAQSQTQFTPAQIFEIARRAEAEGRHEQALQFYHHLIDHCSGSPEARAAQEAAIRLGHQQPASLHQPSSANGLHETSLNGLNGTSHNATTQPPANGPASTHAAETMASAHAAHAAAGTYANLRNGAAASQRQERIHLQPAVGTETAERPTKPTEVKQRSYVIGRMFAWLTVILGTIAAAIGCGLFAAVFVAPQIVGAVSGSESMITGAISAFSVIVVGILLVLAGLTARAVFSNARVIQGLALIEQSRLAGRRPN